MKTITNIDPAVAALYNKFHSLQENSQVGKNDPLPDTYRNFPYQYTRTNLFMVLRKNNDEVFLQGDDETKFIKDCNRAKQKGRSISEVIEEYFIR